MEIVPGAFGDSPAVRVRGGDAAGLDAAAAYLAGRLPSLWETRRGEVDFTAIEEDARAFLRSRSSAGQAARALVHLDDLSPTWSGGDVTSLEVDVFLEEASAEVGAFLERGCASGRASRRFRSPRLHVTGRSRSSTRNSTSAGKWTNCARGSPPTWCRGVNSGDRVEAEILVSEPPDLRMRLQAEFERR